MDERILAAAALLAIVTASSILYDHRGRNYAQNREASEASPRSFQWVYTWVRLTTPVAGLGALLSESALWLPLHREAWLVYAGLAVSLLGFGLFAWAKRSLGSEYSPCFDAFRPTNLVDRGAYGVVRHPIYGANLALLLGLSLMTGSLWVVLNLVLVGLYYTHSAKLEERELAGLFPEYEPYVARTGRFFPRLSLPRNS